MTWYFDGSGWTHHTLRQSEEWRAHSPLGDAARDAAQEWVRRERPMREAPHVALGKLGTHHDGLAFWLAAIDEHENGGQARAADSAMAPPTEASSATSKRTARRRWQR